MKPSLRFLALALVGWIGFRVVAAGSLPDAEWLVLQTSHAKVQPIPATQFPAVEPVQPAQPTTPQPHTLAEPIAPAPAPTNVRYIRGVVGVPVAMRRGVVTVYQLPPAAPSTAAAVRAVSGLDFAMGPAITPAAYSFLPASSGGSLSLVSSATAPVSRPASTAPGDSVPLLGPAHVRRVQLTSWALLRSQQTGIAGSRSLAPGGQLGASQAGARLLLNINRQIAVSARLSAPVGYRGGEGAAGVRIQPLVNFPVWVTAERRQAIGRFGGGRNAFALFMEGGVYERPLPGRFALDSYFQAGVVSAKRHDLFADGALTVTRPLWGRVSVGVGVWGGAQPHLGRLDLGPRVSLRVRKNMKLHLDWRQKVAGNARPGSGPALTLASDF